MYCRISIQFDYALSIALALAMGSLECLVIEAFYLLARGVQAWQAKFGYLVVDVERRYWLQANVLVGHSSQTIMTSYVRFVRYTHTCMAVVRTHTHTHTHTHTQPDERPSRDACKEQCGASQCGRSITFNSSSLFG